MAVASLCAIILITKTSMGRPSRVSTFFCQHYTDENNCLVIPFQTGEPWDACRWSFLSMNITCLPYLIESLKVICSIFLLCEMGQKSQARNSPFIPHVGPIQNNLSLVLQKTKTQPHWRSLKRPKRNYNMAFQPMGGNPDPYTAIWKKVSGRRRTPLGKSYTCSP